jgi:O-succinylbenzoate synthase
MRIDAIILRELHMPLVRPFETSFGVTRNRRIVLAEVQSEGLSGWGECTAGERPFFSGESTDTAWQVLIQELAPALAAESPEHGGDCPGIFRAVRGNPMAKAALENAIWDLEAQREGVSLSRLLGGVRDSITCGVSLGIQPSIHELLAIIEEELAAGYQRIKLKCKPGWDVEVFEQVRSRWPGILLSCDANSAYRLRDEDHIASFDAFDLLMIEQPLWHDDFYFHSVLQRRLNTPICLDESIRNRRDTLAAIEMHNIALSTLEGFTLPGDVSASARYFADDIIEPGVTVSDQGEIAIPDTPGRGYEVRTDLIDRLTARKETIREMALVA